MLHNEIEQQAHEAYRLAYESLFKQVNEAYRLAYESLFKDGNDMRKLAPECRHVYDNRGERLEITFNFEIIIIIVRLGPEGP